MISDKLLHPKSIAVVGASNNIAKPGGKILKNIIDNNFEGNVYAVNPKEMEVQGVKSVADVKLLPPVDLAILAIPAPFCPDAVKTLAYEKETRGFIIISAGFSEESHEGELLEQEIVATINEVGGSLIGPNCVGMITTDHASAFTTPIPVLNPKGVDFVSGSGATAVFIMEAGMPKGLQFASVFSVGNSAQMGVEEVLEYWDKTYDPATSSSVKLIYIETVAKPEKLLKHASSLIKKGCQIAAVKAGSSQAGSRAASSHTGALANSDVAVDALFRKAGIVRCYGREELTTVASVFMCRQLQGKNIAIITHAGGPAVMLTDSLEKGGLNIPQIIDSSAKSALKEKLYPGSSVENPIDFLATGTAAQLGEIIDACENDFDDIDGMAVIFGSPGLFKVKDVYELLSEKMQSCKKPIYPILPSVINVKEDIEYFISLGHVSFPDEVQLGDALTKIVNTPAPFSNVDEAIEIDKEKIRSIIAQCNDGYQKPEVIHELFRTAGVPMVKELVVNEASKAKDAATEIGFPLVMKVVGPVHKTDVGGVVLNVTDMTTVEQEFQRLMNIPDATDVLMAEMAQGMELFMGAKYEDNFGHTVLTGMGGIFVEVMKDVAAGLAPLSMQEATQMIESLKSFKLMKGYRGSEPIDIQKYAQILTQLSTMLQYAPEIKEMDINPLLAKGDKIVAVDARIRIEK
ncbi:CoA-binding protein [Prolixibacteraceae bacterium JC049]|nr:CoA-binding protein [Prolixibacteraceae bacterium JC049]